VQNIPVAKVDEKHSKKLEIQKRITLSEKNII